MGATEPTTPEDMRRHPNDPLKGIAFVYELPDGRLTLAKVGKHVATIDLESWFAHLLTNLTNEISPGNVARLERET